MISVLFLLSSLSLSLSVYQNVQNYDLIISKDALLPDGYSVLSYTVNGQFPGPTLRATVGDRLLINVTNRMFMQESLTMHWHGISQEGTPWADGAGFVTNCPITYGSSFLYNFTVTESGTFWYHAHAGETRIKGTYGFLIVDSVDPAKYHYDSERTLIIGDWYHVSTTDIDAGLMTTPFVWAGNGNSVLLNGKGESKECNMTGSSYTTTTAYSDPRYAKVTTKLRCQGKREIFYVHSGETYLLRILNAATLSYYNFAIAGHTFTLIGADGHSIKQTGLSSIDIGPGCRVEVLVKADQQSVLAVGSTDTYTYLMQAQTDWRGVDNTPAGIGLGYWTYVAPDKTSGTIQTISSTIPPNESRLWQTWNSLLLANISSPSYRMPPSNDKVTKKIVLRLQQEYVNKKTGLSYSPPIATTSPPSSITSEMILAWTMNGVRFNYGSTPALLERYLSNVEGTEFNKDGSLPYRLEMNDIVDVTIQNAVAGSGVCEQHPWHLHGSDFWLVGQGSGNFSTAAESTYNTINPPILDTVTGYPSNHSKRRGDSSNPSVYIPGKWRAPCGWITLRFEVTNPGMWLLHCHVAWHATMGMGVMFDAASELVGKYPDDMALCGSAPERVATMSEYQSEGKSDTKDENYSKSDLLAAILSTFFGTIVLGIIVILIFFMTRSRPSSKPLAVYQPTL